MQVLHSLAAKYDVPAPRYTSYPTVPSWTAIQDQDAWTTEFTRQFAARNGYEGISLYIHLPFCQSLCTYCGCTKKISATHAVEPDYIRALLKEWEIYRSLMGEMPLIREIHLGGGTPTFFSPGHLAMLMDGILKHSRLHPQYSFGVEGHPNNTTKEHLQVLHSLGFRRVSYGIQDTNPDVHQLINRVQPFENVRRVTARAREIGFRSINFDLIYGLPGQDRDRMIRSIAQSLTLRPDRIAFYNYTHSPSVVPNQKLIDESRLPSADEKLAMYLAGKELFTGHGYTHIGMDHFSLPTDELTRAWRTGGLRRNFMGYTVQKTAFLLGLGMSAISDTGSVYAQNDKTLLGYYRSVHAGQTAIRKGYFLNEEDRVFRRHILNLACHGHTSWNHPWSTLIKEQVVPQLRAFARDGLVVLDGHTVQVTELGRQFLRNICKAFDLHQLRRV